VHHPHGPRPTPPALIEIPPEPGKARFADLPLDPLILAALQEMGFRYCTPVQAQSLPHALAGRDLTGRAQTGTGKTAAFLITAFQHFLANPLPRRAPGTCRMLVLAPTRELAFQIHKDAEAIGRFLGFHNLVVFGGMDHQGQRESLRQPVDVLVGTPGRLIDYIRSEHLILSQTEILVIDEADRMLDMGFIPDVRRIVARVPAAGKRQTMLYSATLTPEILRLVDRWLIDPVTIETESENVVTDLITQRFISVSVGDKLAVLLWLLRNEPVTRMLVFSNRRDRSDDLSRALQRHGIDCRVMSGDIPQEKRMRILEDFRKGKLKVIVATDVAARGIHVDDISHVVNFDLPNEPEDYIHRIGRTGRAGVTGTAISFICEYGAYLVPELEKMLDMEIRSERPDEEMLRLPPPDPNARVEERHPRPPRRDSGPRSGGGRRPPSRSPRR
jgi:ATP-dependent RNA helicase RhlB